MIRKQGKPITGSRPAMRPTPNVLSDSAATSRDAQKLVRQPSAPFQSRNNSVNVPAPVNRAAAHPYGSPASGVKPRNWTAAQPVSKPMSTSAMLAAVGEPRLPKGYNPINSGFPGRNFVRSTGPSSQPFAKRRGR